MTASYLLFKVDESLYGINTDFIYEIIELPELSYMAEMPPYFAGLLNLHGEIIKILDLRICLNYPSKKYSLDDLIVILKNPNFFFGFIVSQILDIQVLSKIASINYKLTTDEQLSLSLLSQTAKYEEQIVFILDPSFLIKKAENLPPASSQLSFNSNLRIDTKDQITFSMRAQKIMQPLIEVDKIDSLIPLIIVMLGEGFFGIDAKEVKELLPLKDFVPIPADSSHLLGFTNFRGNILTLVDICPILKIQKLKINSDSHVLVVYMNHIWIGIIVDKFLDLIYFPTKDLQPIPIGVEKTIAKEFAQYTAFYNKNVLGVVDIAKLLDSLTK